MDHNNNNVVQHDSEKSDTNYKHIVNRIDGIHNYFKEFTKVLGTYNAKGSIVRNKTDELAKCIVKYSKVEEFHTTSKLAMGIAAELVAKEGDNQTTAMQRIESKIMSNFTSYGRICKSLKKDIRNAYAAQGKELSKRETFQTFKEKMNEPKFEKVLSDAERDLENAVAESSRLSLLSQEQITKFEHKRLIDLKETMETFLKIEIAKHAKSLELFTEAYKYIHSIDEDADLEALKRGLKLEKMPSNLRIKQYKNSQNQKPTKKAEKRSKSQIEESDESDDSSWNSEIVCKVVGMKNAPNCPNRQTYYKSRVLKNSNEEHNHQKEVYSDSSPTSSATNISNSSPTENSQSLSCTYPGKPHESINYHKHGSRYEHSNKQGIRVAVPKTSRETYHSPNGNRQRETKSARPSETCNYYDGIDKRSVNIVNKPAKNLESNLIGGKRVSFSDEGWKNKNKHIHEEKTKHKGKINSSLDNLKSQSSTQYKSQNPKYNDINKSEDNARKKLVGRSQFL